MNKAGEICNEGVEEYRKGNMEGALRLFELAKQEDPNLFDAVINKASIYLARKEYDKALEEVDGILSKFPRAYRALTMKSEIFLDSGDFENAGRFADLAVKNSLGVEGPLIAKANVLMKTSRLDEAGELYAKALKLSPDNVPALRNMRFLLMSKGEWEKALPFASRVADETSLEEDLLAEGVVLEHVDRERADSFYMSMSDEHPSYPGLALAGAGIAERAGDSSRAVEFYKRAAVAIDVDERSDPDEMAEMAFVLAKGGELEIAWKLVSSPLLAKNANVLFAAAMISIAKGDLALAESSLRSALEKDPGNVKCSDYLLGILQKQGRDEEFSIALEENFALKYGAKVPDEEKMILFRFCVKAGRYERACEIIDSISLGAMGITAEQRELLKSRILSAGANLHAHSALA